VEEAAKLRVHQIVASRRQVGEVRPGYTGYTSESLARAVRELSGGATTVVRDHGGPYQNGDSGDDWTAALDADVAAGFGGLHLDVSGLPQDKQPAELARLCQRYAGKAAIEVGGERDTQGWLYSLLEIALKECQPYAAVAALGGNIHADRQCGALISEAAAAAIDRVYACEQVVVKAHNLDWLGRRHSYRLNGLYNVAPEFGNVEIDAWLQVLPYDAGQEMLGFAYRTGAWRRWFAYGEGTFFERARAALRYHLETPPVARVLALYDDGHVRRTIADAITCG
jgi:hypothetical protein